MRKTRIVYVLIVALGLSFAAWAQSDKGRIAGMVADSTGAIIPGAEITLRNEKTGVERKLKANEQGTYVVNNLAPAPYTVIAQAAGLGPTTYANITLTVGQERTLNLILQPSTMAQEINVSGGELVVIDTSSARMGANVNEREVASMPLNGRQLSQLYLLAPGATTAGGGS